MKTRDRRAKPDFQRKAHDKKGGKQEVFRGGKRQTGVALSPDSLAKAHARSKRSGVEAVKLHLKTTGDPGRTSRSATAISFYKCVMEEIRD